MTLAEFLLARVAEDERDHEEIHRQDCHLFASPLGPFPCNCRIPAHVLAECEAKRQIVELAQKDLANADDYHADQIARSFNAGAAHFAHNVLLRLALPYAAHPDYREEWRP